MSAVLETVDTGEDLSHEQTTDVKPAETPADKPDTPATGAGDGAAVTTETPAVDTAATQAKRTDVVPHAALHEAREQNKQLRSQIAALEAQPKLTGEDAELLKELRAARTAANNQEPDFLQDPKGYVDTKLDKALKRLDETEGATNETKAQIQQQRNLQQLLSTVQTHETSFVKQTPDYQEALTHARSVRSEQLKIWYPQATDVQIQQALANEEITSAAQVLQAGGNPAEAAYRYAKTLGYQIKAAPAAEVVVDAKVPDKSAARSLGGGGGGAPGEVDPSETEDAMPELTGALAERFGVKRRR